MSNLKNKKILVTGAGGFIGSHLVEALVKLDAKVRAFLRYTSDSGIGHLSELEPAVREDIEMYRGEIRDFDSVKKAMKDIDIVFNLAALTGIPYSYQHPVEVFETNTLGILNILSASRDMQLKRIVHTSSSEVYGSAQYVPIDEKHPLQPQSPYSASKIAADSLALSFYYSFGTPVSIIRPFNAYGPRQSIRAVIPTIILQLLKRNKISLGNLQTKRDFTFVKDTVQGFIKIAESPESIGEIINVGSSSEISIEDLAKKISAITGRQLHIDTDKVRLRPEKSEVKRLFASNKKAKELTDWQPNYSLDKGLGETVEFYRRNLKDYYTEEYGV